MALGYLNHVTVLFFFSLIRKIQPQIASEQVFLWAVNLNLFWDGWWHVNEMPVQKRTISCCSLTSYQSCCRYTQSIRRLTSRTGQFPFPCAHTTKRQNSRLYGIDDDLNTPLDGCLCILTSPLPLSLSPSLSRSFPVFIVGTCWNKNNAIGGVAKDHTNFHGRYQKVLGVIPLVDACCDLYIVRLSKNESCP